MNDNKKQVGNSSPESITYDPSFNPCSQRTFMSVSDTIEDQRKAQIIREYEITRAMAWVHFCSANIQAEVTAIANDCSFREKSVSKRADIMLEEFDERFREVLTK